MPLRPYQQEAVDATFAAWKDFDRVLIVCPTGTGKTVIFAEITKKEIAAGRRVLILAHRDELIRQAQDKLYKFTGLRAAIEKADETAQGSMFMATVGSIQTLCRQNRLAQAQAHGYDTIITDEAHHVLSVTYQRVLQAFPHAKVLGVTATPTRGDKRSLTQYFEAQAYEYKYSRAKAEGFLCKLAGLTVPLKIDINSVRTTAGDFNDADLGNALDPYLPRIADAIAEVAPSRKTLIFVPLIATSERLTAELVRRGVAAEHIDGMSDNRREKLARFNTGETRVLINSMLLTEGYDQADVGCIANLRCTKIPSFYQQIMGRGMRPVYADGFDLSTIEGRIAAQLAGPKPDLLILDFLWQLEKGWLCHASGLIAESEAIATKMTQIQEDKAGEQLDLKDLEEEAERNVAHEREEALAKELAAQSHKKKRVVDPMAFAIDTGDRELQEYEPLFGWQKLKPSPGQIKVLERFGIDTDKIESRGHASAILDRLIKRSKEKLASPKQLRTLKDYGYEHGPETTFDKAKATIDEIANNGWRKRTLCHS